MSSVSDMGKKKVTFFLHWLIVLILMFGFRYVPPVGEITPYGMQILGIFLGLVWGWMFLDFLNPSLLAFLVVVLFVQGQTVGSVTQQSLGNENIFMCIVILALAQYFEDSGLNKYLANWFVSRKINIGRPWIFSGLLMFATFFFSAFAQIMPAMILMWSITYQIAGDVGLTKQHRWVTFLLVGICMAGSYGCIAAPWQIMGIVFLAAMTDAIGVTVNMGLYCLVMTAFSVCSIILYVLFGRFVLRIDVTNIRNEDDRFGYMRQNKMNNRQKQASLIMLLFIVLLMAPNFLPTNWPIISQLNTLTATGTIVLIIILISLFRDKETGKEMYNTNALLASSSQWNLIIMCGICFLLINLMESDEAGVINTAVSTITPLVNDLGQVTCIIIIALVLGILTQFLHNMVLGLIFIPIVAGVMVEMGGSPIAATLAISAALMTSFLTPAASTQSAMLFGMNEETDKKRLVGFAGMSVIAGLLCDICILMPISLAIF